MSELTQVRPLELIEAEINFYKAQTANGIIEIGKRLIEAKEQVQHGEWAKWLEYKVDFTQNTAGQFMRVAREFSNSESIQNLGTRKLFLLLELPSDQREEFAEQNSLEEMTTRQVEAAVKEWKQVANDKAEEARKFLEEKQAAESKLRTTDQVLRTTQADVKMLQDTLQKERDNSKKEMAKLQQSIADTKKQIADAKASGNDEEVKRLQNTVVEQVEMLEKLQDENDQLQKQLKEQPIEATATITKEVIPEEVQKELDELRKRAVQPGSPATLKYKIYFDDLVDTFKKLLGTLAEIKETDTATYVKYKKATASLVEKIGLQVYDAVVEPAHQEAASSSELTSDDNCGICKQADMDGVSDEQLDDSMTLCKLSNEVVSFKHCCSRFEDVRS